MRRLCAFALVAVMALTSCAMAGQKKLPPGPAFDSEIVGLEDNGIVMPVPQMPEKPMKIAVLGLENNQFWGQVKEGAMAAKRILAEKNCTVDWIVPGEKHTTDFFGQALDACIVQEYDAVAVIAGDSGLVPYINRAVDAGIPVATFNAETTSPNKRLFYVGADSYLQGGVAADFMAKALGNKGKVGIENGFFSVEAQEIRRQGFEDRLKEIAPNIEIVSRVETQDKNDIAQSVTQDMITAFPDLAGVYVIGAGQYGACRAVEEAGKVGQITIVCHDIADDLVEYLKSGILTCTIGQDSLAQGRDPAIRLYNYLIGGIVPPAGRLFTDMPAVTPENFNEYWPVRERTAPAK